MAVVLTVPVGAAALMIPWLGALVPTMRLAIPIAGFAWAGAVGGESLGCGPRGMVAFAAGGAAAGLLLVISSGNLAGLTGHENPLVVVTYGVTMSVLAFGATGLVGGLILRRGSTGVIAAGFALGGAVGGMAGVIPFLVARFGPAGLPPLVAAFVALAASLGSVLLPLMTGGVVTARTLDT